MQRLRFWLSAEVKRYCLFCSYFKFNRILSENNAIICVIVELNNLDLTLMLLLSSTPGGAIVPASKSFICATFGLVFGSPVFFKYKGHCRPCDPTQRRRILSVWTEDVTSVGSTWARNQSSNNQDHQQSMIIE